ncbi:hypothetical protein GKZ89_13985 [Bacillus mangrovi]|uniref:4-alpha-L-fucosyltransferase n=1 Tax=Metabacillus mangrovi TaxID=1491830 RepID=A0A7X2V5J3_9BACI|nr:TDP-N-acetylfucosamine:lipid II N-acetylfucosaminyltransferase [Metabacillus mangrovi]MTH54510.1 hypothetical protein [Metabacillus mangrovi]
MKYLHVFSTDENEKFSKSFIEFVNSNFNSKDHVFLLSNGKETKTYISNAPNLKILPYNLNSILLISQYMIKSKRIFFHGFSNNKYIDAALFFQPLLLKKSFWIIWGGDLYLYKSQNESIRNKIREMPRRFIFKNIGGLITHIKGDYELAKKWYGAKGKYYYSFMYLSNLHKKHDDIHVKKDNKIYIQVGNSALDTNEHIEIFNKLKIYKEEAIEIICPLSYAHESNPNYRDKVIETGRSIFGDKFNPIVEFLPFNEYVSLLSKVDIAIFNHKRQQAVGNITTLLGLGKKVYIRNDITTWDFCREHGLKVFNANGNLDDLFVKMDNYSSRENVNNVKSMFSEEKLIEDLNKLFS